MPRRNVNADHSRPARGDAAALYHRQKDRSRREMRRKRAGDAKGAERDTIARTSTATRS